MKKLIPIFLFTAGIISSGFSQTYEVTSLDNNIKLTVEAGSSLSFMVTYKNTIVIDKSEISMTIQGKEDIILGGSAKVKKKTITQVNEIITPVVAQKTATIRNDYKQLTLTFSGYAVEFRVFDEGVAYRFITTMKKDMVVDSEKFNLKFPEHTTSFFPEEETLISHYERLYPYKRLDTLTETTFCSLPVLMKVNNSVNVLLTEADLYDYPGMFMYGMNSNGLRADFPKYVVEAKPKPGSEDRNQVITSAEYIAKTSGNRSFPWRVMVISDEDKTLLQTQLVYQLSRPLKIAHPEWIKPGRVAWDWYNANNIYGVDFESGLNTETYKYYIDFASKHGIEYVILDEGWTKSTTIVRESNPDIDVKELIEYGKNKNVGIILWMLWGPLDKDIDVLKLYKEWGVKGIKVDFMQRADQYMVNFYERVAAACAEQNLLVDYHGGFKPSGLRRAYPNVISYEGVKGNENNKWSTDVTPEHNVTIPFTRMVAGPMDFTPGAMINAQQGNFRISHFRPMSLGTRCHQVAMYVVYESPLQMLCDAPSTYYKEQETTTFITQFPSVWDEIKVLHAKVSDYIVIARRKGDKWYIGAMTDWTPRELDLELSFLNDGEYTMELMRDGTNAHHYAQDYKHETIKVNSKTKHHIKLAPGGGWAAILTKN